VLAETLGPAGLECDQRMDQKAIGIGDADAHVAVGGEQPLHVEQANTSCQADAVALDPHPRRLALPTGRQKCDSILRARALG